MSYRQATPTEIAQALRRQVVETAALALDPHYSRSPKRLRHLLHSIEVCARSCAEWLEAQKATGQ